MKALKLFKAVKYISKDTFRPSFLANRIRATRSYLGGRYYVSAFPSKLHIEITNVCNLDCIMCPRSKMKRKVGFMEEDTFRRIIDEIAGKTEFSYLHLMGESVLHPKLFDFIEYGKNAGVAMGMASNMTVLDEEKAARLQASGLDFLVLSVDGITKESYEKIRLKADFETTMKNVENFLRTHKPGTPPHTAIQMIFMKGTEELALEYADFWKKFNPDSVRIKPFQTWQGDQADIKSLAPKQIKKLNRPCDRPWRHAIVLWDGTVVPCEFDYDASYPLGNINDKTFAQIWNSEAAQNLRRAHCKKDRSNIELCSACDYVAPGLLTNIAGTMLDVRMTTRIISDLGL